MIGIAATFVAEGGKPVLAPFAVALALFVMAGALTDLAERTGLFRVPLATVLAPRRRAAALDLGHARSRISASASPCSASSARLAGARSASSPSSPAQVVSIRHYDLTFDGMTPREGPNYRELSARFTVRRGADVLGVLEPAKRSFAAREMSTTEAALLTRGFSQLYLSLGDQNPDGSLAVRLYHKPLVLLIWLGALVMVVGGALSLSDRRLRVGAPRPARARTAMQPAE